MTMKTSFLIFAVALVLAMPAMAQSSKNTSRPSQNEWLKGMRTYKHDMLVKEMELTKAQQDEFIPLYTQMEEEIYQANKQVRDLENKITNSKETVSELEYGKAAEAISESSLVVAKIENEYFQKFAKILSNKQLFLLKRSENRFVKSMISKKANNKSKKKQ